MTGALELEKILLAIRKDLGYTNKGLKDGDLLRIFLKGVDARVRQEKAIGTSKRKELRTDRSPDPGQRRAENSREVEE